MVIKSEKIIALLRSRNMTAKEMGDKVGITKSMATYITQGLRDPSLAVAVRIANLFKVPLDEIVNRE